MRTTIVCSAFVLAGSASAVRGQEEMATEVLQASHGSIFGQGPGIQLVIPSVPGVEQLSLQSDTVGVPPVLPIEVPSDQLPALSAESEQDTSAPVAAEQPVATEQAREVVGVGQFGHFERRAAPRPYAFIGGGDLDADQQRAVQRWEQNPFYLVWVYDITPSAANNWAGWGPPPPGFMDRTLFERGPGGTLIGDGNPWPPPGDPAGAIDSLPALGL